MTKLARFTLTTALMGSLAFPALAQSSTTSNGPMQPPVVKTLPGLHHRAVGHPTHVHRVADAVRTPAMTSESLPAVPTPAPSRSVAAGGKAAVTSPAPAVRNSPGMQSQDTMMDSKAPATPISPAAKPATAATALALPATPHGSGTTTASPGLPRQQ